MMLGLTGGIDMNLIGERVVIGVEASHAMGETCLQKMQ